MINYQFYLIVAVLITASAYFIFCPLYITGTWYKYKKTYLSIFILTMGFSLAYYQYIGSLNKLNTYKLGMTEQQLMIKLKNAIDLKEEEKFTKQLRINIKKFPKIYTSYIALSRIYTKQQQIEKAIDSINEGLINIKNSVPLLLEKLQISLRSKDNIKEVMQLINKLTKLAPNNHIVINYQALIAFYQGKTELALSLWQKIYKQLPSNSPEALLIEKTMQQAIMKNNKTTKK